MTPINQWNTDYVRTKDLIHFNNQILIANEAPNEDYYLNIYDIENKNYTKLSPNQKDENILFSAFKEAGNLLFSGNKIYSVKPFGNDLYIYDPSSIDTPKSISLEYQILSLNQLTKMFKLITMICKSFAIFLKRIV